MLEVAHRIAALLHQLAHQLVRLRHRAGRVVDELGLHPVPRAAEARRFARCQRNDVQLPDPRRALPELGFCLGPAAMLLDGAVVLVAEARREQPRLAFSVEQISGQRDQGKNHDDAQYP